MDQYTSQFGRAGNLMLIDFDAVTHEQVAVRLDGWVWLLLDSKVRHDLAESAYGERVEQMRAALAAVMECDESVRGFRDLDEARIGTIDDELLRRRALHYVRENERVRAAAAAAAAGETAALGELLCASHASLRDDYEVSCAELDLLTELAAGIDGCAGARMMGGGFGGCTINLVRAEAVDDVVAQVSGGFARRFGYAPDPAVYRLVEGARLHEEPESQHSARFS
jgi:galactokinase